MHRASNAFSVLQATAATLGIAIILWSVGLPSLRFAEAANVTNFSDTLSDSAPGVVSDHTIQFTTPSGVANNTTIVLDFSDGPFVRGTVDFSDIDVATTSDYTLAAACGGGQQIGVNVGSWPTLTLTFCNGVAGASIPANGTTTIQIGLNATHQVAGNAQLTNPSGVSNSYAIGLTAGASDGGETRVAIVDTVLVTASVDTLFNFTVTGVAGNAPVNTADTTGGTTTATSIPFGLLEGGTASTAAQDLSVVTNARSGFVVTVQTDQQLTSSNGADIDGFIDGGYTNTAASWQAPSALVSDEDTYGHWGITSDDNTVGSNAFNVGSGGDRYVSASTTPVEIFNHNGPSDGTGNGEGITRVGYKVQISDLQEAAEDYQAVLTYIATPVF
jgi:hypothetical protein